MKQSHMKVLREIQAFCNKGLNCRYSCPFFDGNHCLFTAVPQHWELRDFEVEE